MDKEIKKSNSLLGDIVTYTKYAKYITKLKRRENWEEIVERYRLMMIKKYPQLESEININIEYVLNKKVLPSMRMLQFSGVAIERNETRGYNCSFLPIDDYRAFSETMFLLLSGTGVGYSVQKHHIEKLPEINIPLKSKKFLVGDSIEGWSDAIKALIKSYFGISQYKPRFDFSDIREKGARLVTAGGKAPGPDPLRICLTKIEAILHTKNNGEQLTPLECHDILCHIADAVLSGGIRRAAMLALFSFDDKEMTTCKHGSWWELNSQRGRANNSAVIVRNRVKKQEFEEFWGLIKDSRSGEPGISWTNDPEYGFNPCHEISLRPFQYCNLTEISGVNILNQDDLNNRAKVAAFFGTLQAGFTDFHYLRSIWKKTTEKDALIGVGITGIADGSILNLNLKNAVEVVNHENERIARIININIAARTTCIKPSGTTSTVLGCSSGIHAWYADKYIRNIQCSVGDDLYNYFVHNHPNLIKLMDYQYGSAVIGIPQQAPSHAILRSKETAIDFLERVKRFNIEWVQKGHRKGPNYNNVSATVNIKDDEWDDVKEWMWNNRDAYSGISVLPYDNGTYKDAPFEVVSDKIFNTKLEYVKNNIFNLTDIIEEEDNTAQSDEIACGADGCVLV